MDELFQLFQRWCAEHPKEREMVFLRMFDDESGGLYRTDVAYIHPRKVIGWRNIAEGIAQLQKKVKQLS